MILDEYVTIVDEKLKYFYYDLLPSNLSVKGIGKDLVPAMN